MKARRAGWAWGLTAALWTAACGGSSGELDGADARTAIDGATGDGGLGSDAGGDAQVGGDAGPPDASLGDVGAGGACSARGDCRAGLRCTRDDSTSLADGLQLSFQCMTPAGAFDDGALCSVNSDCESGFCALAGSCVSPCEIEADCPQGSACQRVFTPVADDAMQFHSACVHRVDAPAGVRVTPRGPLGQTLRRRVSTPVGLELDFTHSAEVLYDVETTDREALGVLRVDDAQGNVLFDVESFGFETPRSGVNPIGNPLSFRYPNGPNAPPAARSFTLQLTAEQSNAFVTKLERDLPGRVLDLNLFYVGIEERPAGDRGPPIVAEALDVVAELYAPDVAIGEVRQFAVVGAIGRRLEFVDASTELQQLWPLSAGAGRPAINVFLVEDIDGALGISGGIPGPAVAHGTVSSGVAVAMGFLRDDGELLGTVIGHEVGHHLGLFHTTEFIGLSVEPLTDTPVCASDTNRNGIVEASECGDADAGNLMFWSGSGQTLTRQQRDVMLNAMVLR